jgi:hypothetical protein
MGMSTTVALQDSVSESTASKLRQSRSRGESLHGQPSAMATTQPSLQPSALAIMGGVYKGVGAGGKDAGD